MNQNNSRRGGLAAIRKRARVIEEVSGGQVDSSPVGPASGNLFLAIALVQTGLTELASIAEACYLPLDTVEEIAAAHEVNMAEARQQHSGCEIGRTPGGDGLTRFN